MLDTRNISDRSTDAALHVWASGLKAYHLRIEDNRKRIARITDRHANKLWAGRDFVFGRSDWISLSSVRKTLTDMFCVLDQCNPSSQKFRNVILVGHAVENEDRYMAKLGKGFSMQSFGTIVAVVDTQILNRDGRDKLSLVNLLAEQDIPADYHHNGGNDAARTLAVCVANEIDRLMIQGLVQSSDGSGMTAASAVERMRETGELIKAANPLDPNRCDICGKFGHATDECHTFTTCTACGNSGHPRARCIWSECQVCKAKAGHLTENCPKTRGKKNAVAVAAATAAGPSRGSAAAAKALEDAQKSVYTADLTNADAFPTLGAAACTTTLATQKTTATPSTQGGSALSKQGQPGKKGRKRFAKLEM